jgi:hypothetical protein
MTALTRNSNPELLKLPDCEGLQENGKCRWLKIPACSGVGCSYYQKMDSLAKAQERLRSLDEETQERIAQKYYGSFRPWMDTGEKLRR